MGNSIFLACPGPTLHDLLVILNGCEAIVDPSIAGEKLTSLAISIAVELIVGGVEYRIMAHGSRDIRLIAGRLVIQDSIFKIIHLLERPGDSRYLRPQHPLLTLCASFRMSPFPRAAVLLGLATSTIATPVSRHASTLLRRRNETDTKLDIDYCKNAGLNDPEAFVSCDGIPCGSD